jgi:hypothetical protein
VVILPKSISRTFVNKRTIAEALIDRSLTMLVATLILTGSASAQQSIHQVDFGHFVYPLSGPLLGHHGLVWLDPSRSQREIRLVAGSDLKKISSFVMDGKEYAQYEGFKLDSVKFADLTGDARDEAIVVLRYLTGGTQTSNYVYVYTFEDGHPKLLAYCHTGDRAYSGLYGVNGSGGTLVFELFDPDQAWGNCCSSGVIVRRFRWKGDRFEPIGVPEHRAISPPVSIPPGD